jgi:beta-alanine--pyruvate transaminase
MPCRRDGGCGRVRPWLHLLRSPARLRRRDCHLNVYQEEAILEKVARIAECEAAIHDIKRAYGVVRDIRNLELLGAVEIEPAPTLFRSTSRRRGEPSFPKRDIRWRRWRYSDPFAALIINEDQVGQIADGLKSGIRTL